MKKTFSGYIHTDRLTTKSAYAESIGITPGGVQKQVLTGRVICVPIDGGELIVKPK
jgi:hypothetical protein